MKTKIVVLVGIALCALLLISPALASSVDTLEIYGNANEDDTIDMRDLTYVKLIFFGKKPETELADAKYDGKINPLDFIQIKLIIVGKEKELTIEDAAGEVVTVNKPIERIVVQYRDSAEILRAFDVTDKIVGISNDVIQGDPVYYPKLSKLPIVGKDWGSPDYEAILNLNPDVILEFVGGNLKKEKLPDVAVISLQLTKPGNYIKSVRKFGYIIDKEEEAEKLLNWDEGWRNMIKSRTEGLSEDKKPKVLLLIFYRSVGAYTVMTKTIRAHEMCVIAGGKNIAKDLPGWSPKLDPEWVIVQNPDIIVISTAMDPNPCGYGTDDPAEWAAFREDILNRPELANVVAVKTENVYMIDWRNLIVGGGSGGLIGSAYMAKWFHPELFDDLDPRAIHQEYIDKFQRVNFNVYEHGVFVYPPLED
jgi:iron complex transport system substrate-binding protein